MTWNEDPLVEPVGDDLEQPRADRSSSSCPVFRVDAEEALMATRPDALGQRVTGAGDRP